MYTRAPSPLTLVARILLCTLEHGVRHDTTCRAPCNISPRHLVYIPMCRLFTWPNIHLGIELRIQPPEEGGSCDLQDVPDCLLLAKFRAEQLT